MKKFMSILLSLLMMLLPLAGWAEETATYIHADGSFGFVYPALWVELSRTVISDVLKDDKAPRLLVELCKALKPVAEETDLAMVTNLFTSDSIVVTREDLGAKLTDEQLLENTRQLQEGMAQQNPGVVFEGEPVLLDSFDGEHTYAVLAYSGADAEGKSIAVAQARTMVDTMQYTIALTVYSTDEEAAAAVEAMSWVMDTFTTW